MNIFQKQGQLLIDTWKDLTSLDHLDDLIQRSYDVTQVIFKHSVSCGISWGAKHRLEKDWDIQDELDFHYLDLISHRSVSNAVAEKLGVVHQSPQLIIVKDGRAVQKVSHHDINFNWLEEYKN